MLVSGGNRDDNLDQAAPRGTCPERGPVVFCGTRGQKLGVTERLVRSKPMVEHYPLLVPDARASDEKLEVTAPYDRSPIAIFDLADETGIESALSTAYRLYQDRAGWLPVARRIEILENAIELMEARADALARRAAREGGKPMVDSNVEVARAIDGLKICIETLRTDAGAVIPMNLSPASEHRLALTLKEPIGAVVALSAFNHPLNLIVHQVAPAFAAGCPVIVKPAEDTPVSCYEFVRILHEAGCPPGWCQALTTKNHAVTGALIADQRVGFFSFIGSAVVGWMLRGRLAPGTRCALEHGGAAPVIVAADADLDDAVPLIVKGGFYHAGQVCVSVQRVFVHESTVVDFVERLVDRIRRLKVGDPTHPETDIGPLIRPGEVDRVEMWVQEAIDAGADRRVGGHRLSATCYEPTVLVQPPHDAKVSQLEIFGPVLCVYPYRHLEDAIERANALPFAFQAAVFTRNIDTAMRAYKGLAASAVMINDHTAFRVDWMPFAGLKHSGLGIGGIPYTMRDMQVEKMMLIRATSL